MTLPGRLGLAKHFEAKNPARRCKAQLDAVCIATSRIAYIGSGTFCPSPKRIPDPASSRCWTCFWPKWMGVSARSHGSFSRRGDAIRFYRYQYREAKAEDGGRS